MSSASGLVTYIGAKELANLLSSPEKASTVVIDVRDEDFGDGGSIVGAANITSDNFRRPEGLDAIIEAHCGPSVQNVVVHCALSQVRGPRAANSLADALLAHGRTLPSIRVLQGGFIHFARQFHDNPSLVAPQ